MATKNGITRQSRLKYHEHDGHTLPKRVAREALEALGVPQKEQP